MGKLTVAQVKALNEELDTVIKKYAGEKCQWFVAFIDSDGKKLIFTEGSVTTTNFNRIKDVTIEFIKIFGTGKEDELYFY